MPFVLGSEEETPTVKVPHTGKAVPPKATPVHAKPPSKATPVHAKPPPKATPVHAKPQTSSEEDSGSDDDDDNDTPRKYNSLQQCLYVWAGNVTSLCLLGFTVTEVLLWGL